MSRFKKPKLEIFASNCKYLHEQEATKESKAKCASLDVHSNEVSLVIKIFINSFQQKIGTTKIKVRKWNKTLNIHYSAFSDLDLYLPLTKKFWFISDTH